MADAKVNNDTIDVGVHKLAVGGAIVGRLPLRFLGASNVRIAAVDTHGIEIEWPVFNSPISKEYSISGLWPDDWIVELRKDNKAVAKKKIVIRRGENTTCDFRDN